MFLLLKPIFITDAVTEVRMEVFSFCLITPGFFLEKL